MSEEPNLEWTPSDGADENATRARCDWWILETKSDAGGVTWLVTIDPDPDTDGKAVNGSFDNEWRPQPVPTLRQAQLDAERSLRRSAERIVERLPFGGGALARLGLRRVPEQPTREGQIAIDAMFNSLRELVEGVGRLELAGTVHNVRESKARNVYFVLRAGRCSLACRMSSTQARAIGRPEEGATVIVRGVPTVFTDRGEVQLDVLGIETKPAA